MSRKDRKDTEPSKTGKKASPFKRFFIKPLVWLISVVLALALLLLALFLIFPGPVAELAVKHVVSRILGVKINVEKIDVYLLRGRVEVRSFTIYNPEDKGYTSECAIHLGHVDAEIEPQSLIKGQKIVIRDLTLKDIAINYEADLLLNSNIQDIIDNINRLQKEDEKKEKETGEKAEPKGLQVDRFVMENVGLYVVVKGTTPKVGVPLTIEPMGPLGDDSPEGISPVSFALRVMSTILVDASKQAGIQISDAALGAAQSVVSSGTEMIDKAADHISEQGKKAVESLNGLF